MRARWSRSLWFSIAAVVGLTEGCTNLIITKGASAEGVSTFTYTADSGTTYGEILFLPDRVPDQETRDLWEWGDGHYVGQVPETKERTYRVVGNMNEHQLGIGETTFTGLPTLPNPPDVGSMDYGSLIALTLQRAKTAREAIDTMAALLDSHGFVSGGESFTVADPEEIWLMEVVGKGREKGAVWVARRVPDGYVSGHANQARITTFPQNDPQNTLFAADVVTFAVRMGLYPATAPAEEFNFCEAYDPITFHGARYGEVRVWSFFRHLVRGLGEEYLPHVQGRQLLKRMPLWVKPERKVTLNETFWYMRTHFEGTWFDNTADVGAGPFASPIRYRPPSWTFKGVEYANERHIATLQTGWHIVAQMRRGLPDAIGGVQWFGVDDTATSVRFPVYAGVRAVPAAYTRRPLGGEADARTESAWWITGDSSEGRMHLDAAFWVFNLVSAVAYSRWSEVRPELNAELVAREARYMAEASALERAASAAHAVNPDKARDMLTDYVVRTGQALVKDWRGLWMRLTAKYRDGFTFQPKPLGPKDLPYMNAAETGYPDAWHARIVADTGAHYANPLNGTAPSMLLLSKEDFIKQSARYVYSRYKSRAQK